MKPILLVLQCYPGDQHQAMRVARLIADMEPGKNTRAHFMFAWRWDCKPDTDTMRYVGRKFPVIHSMVSTRKTTGWPGGPNDLFMEAYGRFCQRIRQKIWGYDAALFFEPDCVPLDLDWIAKLQAEWYEREQMILGFFYGPGDHPVPHVNGNLMISPKYQRYNREFYACPGKAGWDVHHAKSMLSVARASRLIYNDYARPSIPCHELFEAKHYGDRHPLANQVIQPVFYHGVKGGGAIECVRAKFSL